MGSPTRSSSLQLVPLLLCAGLALGCSDSSLPLMPLPIATKVVVELKGAVADVARWSVQADLDGKPAKQITELDGGVVRFALELDAGVQGRLTVRVQGAASYPFIISKGSNSTDVGAADLVTLPIDTQPTQVCTQEGWCWERPYPSGRSISAMWAATDSSEVWAVGGAGLLLHYDGKAWDLVASPTDQDMLSVFGLSSSEVYFGGSGPAGPLLLRWNGKDIVPVAIPDQTLKNAVVAIWASSSQDLWCAVQGRDPVRTITNRAILYHLDGSGWSPIPQSDWGVTSEITIGAMGGATAGHPWIFGFQKPAAPNQVFLVNKDDTKWNDYSAKLTATVASQYPTSMVVKSDTDVWLAYDKKVLHFDGATITDPRADLIPGSCSWAALAVASSTDVWAAPIKGGACNSTRPWSYDGSKWSQVADGGLPVLSDGASYLTMASTSQAVWAAGVLGVLRQYDRSQSAWKAHLPERLTDIDMKSSIRAISGTSPTDLWAVANNGLVLHGDGNRWTNVEVKVGADPNKIMGFSAVSAVKAQDVWVITGYSPDPLHYDGTTWSYSRTGGTQLLNAVWAAKSTTDVWVTGGQLTVYRWNGSAWSDMTPTQFTMPLQNQGYLNRYQTTGIWGVEGQAVWVVGGNTDAPPARGTVVWQYDFGTQMWSDLSAAVLIGAKKTAADYPPEYIWAGGKDSIWVGKNSWTPSVSFTNNAWNLADWCLPTGADGADSDALIWGSAPDSIWCFGRHRNYARGQASGVTSSGYFGGAEPNIINGAWSASRDDVWIVGNQGVIMHHKPRL